MYRPSDVAYSNGMYHYIALLDGIYKNGQPVVEMSRLEYALHTFSFENEHAYAPTGDVVFESPNHDKAGVSGGAERAIQAVLDIQVTVELYTREEIANLLEVATVDTIQLQSVHRSRRDLEALIELSTHAPKHTH